MGNKIERNWKSVWLNNVINQQTEEMIILKPAIVAFWAVHFDEYNKHEIEEIKFNVNNNKHRFAPNERSKEDEKENEWGVINRIIKQDKKKRKKQPDNTTNRSWKTHIKIATSVVRCDCQFNRNSLLFVIVICYYLYFVFWSLLFWLFFYLPECILKHIIKYQIIPY